MSKSSAESVAEKAASPPSRREEFIRALAEYLAGNAAHMSILLEMGRPEAQLWAKLRGATPLRGWQSVEEAEKELSEWFARGMT